MAENERSSKRRRLSAPSTQIQPRERDNVTGNRTELPCNADPISSHDLQHWRSLFGLYLDVQKHIEIETLTEREIKGRFKSFVGKWNRGELSRGWYEPATKDKADAALSEDSLPRSSLSKTTKQVEKDESDDDHLGPALPSRSERHGPTIARHDDLQARNEQALDDAEANRQDMRHERKQERKIQKERLDELVPRAEPGTRERQLEKKHQKAATNKSFRESNGNDMQEVNDGQLMGDVGRDDYKAQVEATKAKQSERELRREEALRTRAAEREERMAVHRAKEDKTMEMLKALAQQRYA